MMHFAIFFVLLAVAHGQIESSQDWFNAYVSTPSNCRWYNWTAESWPTNSSQNFAPVAGSGYFDSRDFEEGEQYEGQEWEDVFWDLRRRQMVPRPLGFRYAKLEAFNAEMPCVHAEDTAGYKVELMLWTFQKKASIAVKDLSVNDFASQEVDGATGGDGKEKLYRCFIANTNEYSTLNLAFFCENDCTESDTDLLWRFRRSGFKFSDDDREFASENPDMWCNMIASNVVWPNEIQDATPEDYNNANEDEYNNGASRVSMALAGAVALFAMAWR